MSDLLQQVIVSGVVILAVATLVRRVVGFVKPSQPGEPPCKSCASSGPACHPTEEPAQPQAHPAVLYRPARH